MTTPAKSALDEARERLEKLSSESPTFRTWVRCEDLRLVLDALKEAEQRLEQFEECQLDSDGFCTDENCNRHD